MAQELKIHQGGKPAPRHARGRAIPVLSAFDEFDRLFDELLPSSMLRFGRGPLLRGLIDSQARMPRVDLLDRDDDFLLRAEVPGMSKDDLELSIDEASVTLRGSTSVDEHDEQDHYYRREIIQGEFVRVIPLPAAVDTAKAKATLKDGVVAPAKPDTPL